MAKKMTSTGGEDAKYLPKDRATPEQGPGVRTARARAAGAPSTCPRT